MENNKSDVLFKRILFFTKIIMTLLVICLVLFFNFLDYREIKENTEQLLLLNEISQVPLNKVSDNALEEKISVWVASSNPKLEDKYIKARIKLSMLLSTNGVQQDILKVSKGYNGGNNKFQSLTIQNPVDLQVSSQYATEKTVKEAIQIFRSLESPCQIQMLTAVDTNNFARKKDALIQNTYRVQSPQPDNLTILRKEFFTYYEFQNLLFKKDSVTIAVSEEFPGQQAAPIVQNITLPANHENILGPSRLYFAGYDSSQLNAVYTDSTSLAKIKAMYGNQQISKITEMISKNLENNTNAVSLLGFDISRRWFPLAMLVLLCLLNIVIYQNIRMASRENLSIISNNSSDDALELIVSRKTLRFFFWCLSTLLILSSILFTSFIKYSFFYHFIMLACTLLSLFVGLLAFRLSKKL